MKLSRWLAAGAAVVALAGCADYGVGVYGSGYGPGPVADIDYDGYYDGYYGPIYDGYWDNGGAFYYRSREGDRWRKGAPAHFSHEAKPGFNHIQGTAHASPGRKPR